VILFQAFTTAFQTLNDAKDRTMATNYAQQILEDYKNTHFEKINSFSDSLEGTKFTQNVSVQPVNENLKNVIAQINWTSRNNNPKNVNVSTLIYNTQTIAESGSTPMGIVIYAEPYNLLPWSSEGGDPTINSIIFTEIVDEKGDRITDWDDYDVEFSIESVVNLENEDPDPSDTSHSYLGILNPPSDGLEQGIAETIFIQHSGAEHEGYVEIKATLDVDGDGDGDVYDTLTLKVTNDAVAVVLTTDKEIISTEGGEVGTAHLTATIVDAVGDTVETDREIDINIISGPGSLANFTPTVDGVASIDLIAGTTAGVATIMATSNLLEPGSINIEIVDPGAHEINVEAAPTTIAQQGSAVITAYLTDYLGNGISGETINFSTNLGELNFASDTTIGDGSATVTHTMNYAGTATVTAKWDPGDITEISDTVEVLCKNHNLYVSAEDDEIIVNSSTTIFAELTTTVSPFNPVDNETIDFLITEGGDIGSLSNTYDDTNEFGIAFVTLSMSEVGTTKVTGSWRADPTVVTDFTEVICISAPTYTIDLVGDTTISVGDKTTITATISPVDSGITVNFSLASTLDPSSGAELDNYSLDTDVNGSAEVELSGLVAGETVTVTAEVGTASGSLAITCETPSISIDLADSPNIEHPRYWHGGQWVNSYDKISFDITITGGSVDLDSMIVLWESDSEEKLNRVYINDIEIYKNNQGADNGSTIFFNRGDMCYDLVDGNVYTFEMWFDDNVIGKSWTITFLDPVTSEVISTITFDLD